MNQEKETQEIQEKETQEIQEKETQETQKKKERKKFFALERAKSKNEDLEKILVHSFLFKKEREEFVKRSLSAERITGKQANYYISCILQGRGRYEESKNPLIKHY